MIRSRSRLTWRISLLDLRHEYLMFLWVTLGVAAIIAPLLVIHGLKSGLVSSMKARLIENPTNREIRPIEFHSHSPEALARIAGLPGVEILIPDTRLLAASINLLAENDPASQPVDAAMRPTVAGDPLLSHWGLRLTSPLEVVLSEPVARRLAVAQGAVVQGAVTRRGGDEVVVLDLRVAGVLPREAQERNWVYVDLRLLVGAERYRENQPVPGMDQPGSLPEVDEDQVFGSFRLFARGIDDVPALVETLAAQGLETHSEYRNIARIQRLDHALRLIFAIVLLVAAAGGAASMGANVYAGVVRKQRDLGLLKLMGFSPAQAMALPVIQAACLGFAGALVAVLVYGLTEPVINHLLSDTVETVFGGRRLDAGDAIANLPPSLYLGVPVATALLSTLVALFAARRVNSISIEQAMRYE